VIQLQNRILIIRHKKEEKLMREENGELEIKVFALNNIVSEMLKR